MRDVLSTVFCLRGSSHSMSLSSPPLFWHQWDFTAANGSLWVFAWTLFSFALLCAILRSQVDQGAAVFTPVFAVRTGFEMNCSSVQLEADSTYSLIAFIPRLYWHWPVCWADYKESVHSQTSQELHRSQTDLNVHCCFTVMAVSASALSREFTEISILLILNCYFYTRTNALQQKINTAFLKHIVSTHYRPLPSDLQDRITWMENRNKSILIFSATELKDEAELLCLQKSHSIILLR